MSRKRSSSATTRRAVATKLLATQLNAQEHDSKNLILMSLHDKQQHLSRMPMAPSTENDVSQDEHLETGLLHEIEEETVNFDTVKEKHYSAEAQLYESIQKSIETKKEYIEAQKAQNLVEKSGDEKEKISASKRMSEAAL